MNDIIERIYGYSDKQMADRCMGYLSVLSATETKPIGRGRKGTKQVFKYSQNKDVVERIKRSIEHYEKLVESEL
jgi:hypothetical protein